MLREKSQSIGRWKNIMSISFVACGFWSLIWLVIAQLKICQSQIKVFSEWICTVTTTCQTNSIFSWLNAPGIYFKLGLMDLAIIWSQHLIGTLHLLTRCFFFCHFIKLIYYQPTSETQRSWSRQDNFSLHFIWQTFLCLLLVTLYSIQHAYYCMLQSRCVKKSINNTCSVLRQGNTKFQVNKRAL